MSSARRPFILSSICKPIGRVRMSQCRRGFQNTFRASRARMRLSFPETGPSSSPIMIGISTAVRPTLAQNKKPRTRKCAALTNLAVEREGLALVDIGTRGPGLQFTVL